MISQALNIMKSVSDRQNQTQEKDEDTLFGEYIAAKLRKMDKSTNAIVKYQINNIIFETEIGYQTDMYADYARPSSSRSHPGYYTGSPNDQPNAYPSNRSSLSSFKKITENEYVTKYRMKHKVTLMLGLKGRARRIKRYEKKRNKRTVEEIRQFYERDDVSRATAGKKEVKTLKKEKRQRRYLLKTQKDLFKKYKDEDGKAKYSTFKKHRPFYVLHPKLSNRDTCACIKHENFILKTEKLYTLGMIDTKNVDDILAKVLCDPNSKDCAYRQCSTCRDNLITFDWAAYSKDEMVVWEEFAREKNEYVDKTSGNIKTTEKMVKRENSNTMISLTDLYKSDLNTFSKHVYNIKHQYS